MAHSTAKRAFHLVSSFGEDDLLIHEFQGSEHLSKPFEFSLTLMSERDDILPDELIGRRVRLQVETHDGVRHWTGVIASFGRTGVRQLAGGEAGDMTVYQAVMVPWVWQLQLHEDCRIFQFLSVPEIIETVFADFGFSDYEFHLTDDYPQLDYCTQYRESSYRFISRLLERAGIHYFFRHDAEAEVMVFTDNRDHNPLLEPADIRFVAAAADVDEDSDDAVTSLSRSEALRSGRITMRDFNFTRPADLLEASIPSVLRMGDNQAFERFLHPPARYEDQDAGDRLARMIMEVEEIGHDTLEGMGSVRMMSPGYVFDLFDHPDPELDRRYLLVGLHHYGSNNLVAGDAHYVNSFTVIPHEATWRAGLHTPRPVIHGPQTAIVVGPEGEEIHCDEYGRVKVQFHWDRRGKRDGNSSCWLRVAQSWAGRGWGTMYIPRIGMEVVVAFLEGDPDAPLITGCVYNGMNTPPYALPADATKTTVKTYSSKGGDGFNEIRFEDKKGSEQVFIHAQTDLDARVGNDAREHVGHDRSLVVGRDRLEEVHRDQSSYIKRDRIAEVTRDDTLQVAGKQAIRVAESLSVKVDGGVGECFGSHSETVGGDYFLKASANVVIESGANITLKVGGSFIAISSAGIDIQGPMTKINSGGAQMSGQAASLVRPLAAIPAFVAAMARPGAKPEAFALGQVRPGKPPEKLPDHQPDPKKAHWIEVELLDEVGKPVPSETVRVELPDGTVSTGTTNDKGIYRVAGIDPGECQVTFPNLDEKAWEQA